MNDPKKTDAVQEDDDEEAEEVGADGDGEVREENTEEERGGARGQAGRGARVNRRGLLK